MAFGESGIRPPRSKSASCERRFSEARLFWAFSRRPTPETLSNLSPRTGWWIACSFFHLFFFPFFLLPGIRRFLMTIHLASIRRSSLENLTSLAIWISMSSKETRNTRDWAGFVLERQFVQNSHPARVQITRTVIIIQFQSLIACFILVSHLRAEKSLLTWSQSVMMIFPGKNPTWSVALTWPRKNRECLSASAWGWHSEPNATFLAQHYIALTWRSKTPLSFLLLHIVHTNPLVFTKPWEFVVCFVLI